MAERTRTALIVGASRGLGLGLSVELARRGWQVIATVRTAEVPAGLATAVAKSAGRISTAVVDVDSVASVEALVAALSRRKLDLLFLNAGVAGPKHQSVDEVTPDRAGCACSPPIRLRRYELRGACCPMSLMAEPSRSCRREWVRLQTTCLVAWTCIAPARRRSTHLHAVSSPPLRTTARSVVLTLHPGWVRTDMGGTAAPLSIAESVSGLADLIEAPRTAKHRFLDYQGAELPW